MSSHVLLVLLDGRLSWVSDVPYLRASVVKSHFSVLHVLIICLTVQLNIILIVRFQFAWNLSSHAHSSCRQKVELLQ